MSLAIIRSKVQAPPPPGPVLERPRLLRWLERHREERVIPASAEVGFGKTTKLTCLHLLAIGSALPLVPDRDV